MNRQPKLKDVFTDFISKGIFSALQALNVPWKNEYISEELDISFITSYGERKISPLLKMCLDENGELTDENRNRVANILFTLYRKNWEREYEIINAQYNPIENYSMVETHTGTDTKTDTPTNWQKTNTQSVGENGYSETTTQTPTDWVSTETQTPTEWVSTETQTPTNWKETSVGLKADNQADASNSVYAFNSSTAVPVSESDASTSSKNETSRTGTYETETAQTGTYETETAQTGTYETKKEIDGELINTETQTGTFESETEYNTELHRSGNIGVTTSVQMLQEHELFWARWNYFQSVVYKDIAKSLTIAVY